jgi:hypothetical protein
LRWRRPRPPRCCLPVEIRTSAGPSSAVRGAVFVQWRPVHHGVTSPAVPAGVVAAAVPEARDIPDENLVRSEGWPFGQLAVAVIVHPRQRRHNGCGRDQRVDSLCRAKHGVARAPQPRHHAEAGAICVDYEGSVRQGPLRDPRCCRDSQDSSHDRLGGPDTRSGRLGWGHFSPTEAGCDRASCWDLLPTVAGNPQIAMESPTAG